MGSIGVALADFGRFALFKPLRGDPAKNWRTYLLVGFAITWIVGFGRYWDDTAEPLLLRSGVTSILYAIVLSGFIWVLVLGLKPERWSYRNVLLMVMMTALPGIIYAIPVEMFMDGRSAGNVNMIMLAIVATWRMALYYAFLDRVAKLPQGALVVAWLLPPTIIVAALGLYGITYVVASGMGGVRGEVDPQLASMQVIAFLGMASWVLLPLLGVAYAVLVFDRRNQTRAP